MPKLADPSLQRDQPITRVVPLMVPWDLVAQGGVGLGIIVRAEAAGAASTFLGARTGRVELLAEILAHQSPVQVWVFSMCGSRGGAKATASASASLLSESSPVGTSWDA